MKKLSSFSELCLYNAFEWDSQVCDVISYAHEETAAPGQVDLWRLISLNSSTDVQDNGIESVRQDFSEPASY